MHHGPIAIFKGYFRLNQWKVYYATLDTMGVLSWYEMDDEERVNPGAPIEGKILVSGSTVVQETSTGGGEPQFSIKPSVTGRLDSGNPVYFMTTNDIERRQWIDAICKITGSQPGLATPRIESI